MKKVLTFDDFSDFLDRCFQLSTILKCSRDITLLSGLGWEKKKCTLKRDKAQNEHHPTNSLSFFTKHLLI